MGLKELYDGGARLVGAETYAEEERKEQGEQAQQLAQQQRNQLSQTNSGLDVSQYDKPGITECVNWSGFGHADIFKTNQDSIDAKKVAEVAELWQEVAGKLRERGENYATDVSKIVDGGWEGEAADKAREIGKPASDWMKASADAFEMTGNNLNGAGGSAGEASKMVPEPEGHSWGQTARSAIPTGLVGAGVDAVGQMEKREEQEKAAQETMQRVYSPSLTQVDAKMPQYTKPDGSTAEPPPANPGGGPGGGVPGVSGGGVPGGGAGGAGSAPGGGAGAGDLPGGGWSGSLPGGGDSGPPASTSSQSATSPGGPGGMPPRAGAGGGAGAGAGGGAGAGMGGMAGMAGGVGGAGSGQPSPGGRAGAGGAGAGAGGAAGAGGRGGAMGGGMGAGRGGQGQGGDDDHERPSWLEEQDDVWLEDMPRTAPPVLGE